MGVGKPMKTAGYSGTPLIKKLGIKQGFRLILLNQPTAYLQWLGALPPEVQLIPLQQEPADFIHFFTKDAQELETMLPMLKQDIKANGIIWVSWPKKAAKVPTNVTEDVVRNLALSIGLVDVKVCAVSEVWSALKLVIPLSKR